jgi:FKBP-type peptidyl-prolyl cis-trans isomerase
MNFKRFGLLISIPILLASCLGKFVESEDNALLLEENNKILSYSQSNGLNLNAASGIYSKITKPNSQGTQGAVEFDFRIAYTLKTIEGVQIDSKGVKDSVVLNLYTSNLFLGFAQSLLLLKEGETGVFLIPSVSAYGNNPPNGLTKNTPILAEIELLELVSEDKKIDNYIKKKGLTVTEKTSSGLRFIRTSPENTAAVALKDNDNISIKYAGALLNDKVFDSGSFGYIVGATNLIPGFIEGLRKLKKGEKGRIILPSKIGYGTKGSGTTIPPNAPLIFDLEIVTVNGI